MVGIYGPGGQDRGGRAGTALAQAGPTALLALLVQRCGCPPLLWPLAALQKASTALGVWGGAHHLSFPQTCRGWARSARGNHTLHTDMVPPHHPHTSTILSQSTYLDTQCTHTHINVYLHTHHVQNITCTRFNSLTCTYRPHTNTPEHYPHSAHQRPPALLHTHVPHRAPLDAHM